MKIITNLSPNYSKKIRPKSKIKFVIIHYTGMQSEIESINRLKNPKFNVSCHYIINRKGQIIRMVNDLNIAWHAGKSKWKKFINLNDVSLGVELVNRGHRLGYQNFRSNLFIILFSYLSNIEFSFLVHFAMQLVSKLCLSDHHCFLYCQL